MAVRAFVNIVEASVDPNNSLLVEMRVKVNVLGSDRDKFGTTGVNMLLPGLDPSLAKLTLDAQMLPVIKTNLEKSGVVFGPTDTVMIY